MTRQLKQEIDAIVKQLLTLYQPEKIILFGSIARGEASQDSDIDLLIVKDVGIGRIKRAQDVYRLLWQRGTYPVGIDVIVMTPKELSTRLSLGDPFYQEITRSGKVLYSKL